MTRPAKPWTAYGRYGSVGIELVLSILLGYYAGHWADAKWGGGRGYLTALGFVVGVYAGFRALFATAAKMQRDIERAERQERGEDVWSPDAPPSPPERTAPTSAARPARDEKHDDEA